MKSHIFHAKANDLLVSHCHCADAPIAFPAQMDCPWCGCGWLFTCINCRKAFTFAKGVLLNESWEETAARALRNQSKNEPSKDDVTGWVAAMKELHADVVEGTGYVYFDGRFVPTNGTSLRFDGWHSRHKLAYVPHAAALYDRSVMDSVLSDQTYWHSTALPADDS